MTNHIIETIGKNGVKTTPFNIRQFQGPKPGDVIEYPEDAPYPYNKAYGRVDSVEGGKVYICCNMGSVFLTDSGAVSISGGPFSSVWLSDLEFTGELRTVRFWNWGDNSAGAHQGVDYMIDRPVFRLSIDAKDANNNY